MSLPLPSLFDFCGTSENSFSAVLDRRPSCHSWKVTAIFVVGGFFLRPKLLAQLCRGSPHSQSEGNAASGTSFLGCWRATCWLLVETHSQANPIRPGTAVPARGGSGRRTWVLRSLSLSLLAAAQTIVPLYCALLTRITHISSCAFSVNLPCCKLSLPFPSLFSPPSCLVFFFFFFKFLLF